MGKNCRNFFETFLRRFYDFPHLQRKREKNWDDANAGSVTHPIVAPTVIDTEASFPKLREDGRKKE
jgi:hypothetical protein